MNKKIEKDIENILKPFIDPLIKNLQNFDYRHYDKFQEEISNDFENNNENITVYDNIINSVVAFFKETDLPDLFELIKIKMNKKLNKLIKEEAKVKTLLNIVKKADSIIPNISFIIFTRINIEHFKRMLEPIDLLEEIYNHEGQHRARLVLRFFREVSEFVYDNYLRILYEFICVINNKLEINSGMSFGKLVDCLIPSLSKLKAQNLIENDAGMIRNAASHASYIYKNTTDSLIIWDKNKDKIEINVSDLLEKAILMYNISTKIILDVYVYNHFNIIFNNEIIEIIKVEKEKILKSDDDVLKLIFEKIENLFNETTKVNIKR